MFGTFIRSVKIWQKMMQGILTKADIYVSNQGIVLRQALLYFSVATLNVFRYGRNTSQKI